MKSSLAIPHLHLRVANLTRSVDFYTRQLGFVVHAHNTPRVELSATPASPPLLALTEDRSAPRPPSDAAGLFHAALLFPSRETLAHWFNHAASTQVSFDGLSDHGVSEALYLSDPDGNGLEFYADRPRTAWPFDNGNLKMDTRPLDLRRLLASAANSPPAPLLAGAHWGHLHLRASNVDRSAAFYLETLGLALTQNYGDSARFLAADDYHHHIGLNSWGGVRQPQPAHALGLIEFTIASLRIAAPGDLHDPDHLSIHLKPLT